MSRKITNIKNLALVLITLSFILVLASGVIAPSVGTTDKIINNVLLNGATSVNVAPSASITASVTVTIVSGSKKDWKGTEYQIGTSGWTCVNHADHNTAGTYTETFTITAPASVGSYNFQVRASKDNGCGENENDKTAIYTLTNGIVVQQCGNGIKEGTEVCDDGNTNDGDCCSSTCLTKEAETTPCNTGNFCSINDYCNANGVCAAGDPRDCSDPIGCTQDSCDETNDQCLNSPDNSICDNGLYCDGTETCDAQLDCQAGTNIDCTYLDFSDVNSCFWSPDDNSLTYDFRVAFISTCNEDMDLCNSADSTVIHTCDVTTCGAQCDSQNPCADTNCDLQDGCHDNNNNPVDRGRYFDYVNPANSCNTDCTCTQNICGSVGFTTPYSDDDQDGFDTQCGDQCDNDANKIEPGICGCGIQDVDTDNDGIFDCNDDYNCAITNDGIETCDNVDNNCDGTIDEGLTSSTYEEGACSINTATCITGSYYPNNEYIPVDETCNNIDDNCNGFTDEDTRALNSVFGILGFQVFPALTQPAENINGSCSENTQYCSAGDWYNNEGNYQPITEICDGVDNNCDGVIDEGNVCLTNYYCDMDQDGTRDISPSGVCDYFECQIPEGCSTEAGTDNIIGTKNDLLGNQNNANLIFNVDQTQDPTNWLSQIGHVSFTDGITGDVILEFDFDFASNVLDLTGINITTSENNSAIVINGIDLTSQGLTKTAYIKISSSNSVCILDIENATISQTADCTGTDEKSVECNGIGTVDGYTCTSINSTWYKIQGLKHSSVTQYSYIAPVATTTSGGGGGGGSSACTTTWKCSDWSTCNAGTQTRTCAKDIVFCSTTDAKPTISQACTIETTETTTETGTTPEGGAGITGAAIGGAGKIGIAIGTIVALLVLFLIIAAARKRKQNKK